MTMNGLFGASLEDTRITSTLERRFDTPVCEEVSGNSVHVSFQIVHV